jgi:hypothetical protein
MPLPHSPENYTESNPKHLTDLPSLNPTVTKTKGVNTALE